MRSMVEGACGTDASDDADAPSTALRAVPLPRFAGQEALHTPGRLNVQAMRPK
jgi:hypothetical protein